MENKISINEASVEDLTEIEGISSSMANNILKWRDENGPFQSESDLDSVPGIGRKRMEYLKNALSFDKSSKGRVSSKSHPDRKSSKKNTDHKEEQELESLSEELNENGKSSKRNPKSNSKGMELTPEKKNQTKMKEKQEMPTGRRGSSGRKLNKDVSVFTRGSEKGAHHNDFEPSYSGEATMKRVSNQDFGMRGSSGKSGKVSRGFKSSAKKSTSAEMNWNEADVTEFMKLPGMNPRLAKRLMAYREKYKSFQSIQEIKNVFEIDGSPFNLEEDKILI